MGFCRETHFGTPLGAGYRDFREYPITANKVRYRGLCFLQGTETETEPLAGTTLSKPPSNQEGTFTIRPSPTFPGPDGTLSGPDGTLSGTRRPLSGTRNTSQDPKGTLSGP